MTTPSNASREDRIKVLLRIVVLRLVRSALGLVPGVGSALDHLTFGIDESLSSHELKRQFDELLSQVRMLSADHGADWAEQRRAWLRLPAAAEIEEFLNGLSDPDYRDAEAQTLQFVDLLDPSPDSTAETLKMALDEIVLADEALQRQISHLRNIERLWVEGLAGKESLRAFITMARSVRAALRLQESGQDPIWYLDSSIISDYFGGADEWRGTVEPAVSRYLIRTARPNSLKIPRAQITNLIDRFRYAMERAKAASDWRLNPGYSMQAGIREFMALPQDWIQDSSYVSVNAMADQHEFARIVVDRLNDTRQSRFSRPYRMERLFGLATAVAETRTHSIRSGASDVVVLVARGKVLLPSLERIAGEFPNFLVTHPYGPAWLCFLRRESPAARALATREIGGAATGIEAAAQSGRFEDPAGQSRKGWEFEVQKHVPQFLKAANEFHHAVAEEVDRFRQDVLDGAAGWTDSLLEGSELFSSLLAWLDSGLGPVSDAQTADLDR